MAEEAVATPVGNGAADGKPKKKHKLSFPTAFTILFVITILAVIATWFIPAGAYSKVAYVADWACSRSPSPMATFVLLKARLRRSMPTPNSPA